MSAELIPSISIAALLQARDAVMERVEQAMALIREADGIAKAANISGPMYAAANLRYGYGHGSFDQFEDLCRREMDASAWNLLLRESGMAAMLDKTAKDQWHEAIQKKQTAPLTREAIAGTFGQLYEDRGAMFERGVIEVFRSLSWNYKTNQPAAFGKRVIVAVNRWHQGHEKLDDLWRVMCVLDGKPPPDNRNAVMVLLHGATRKNDNAAETPYFKIKLYPGVGNAHLTFTRPELVDRMNAILAKHYGAALPKARRKD